MTGLSVDSDISTSEDFWGKSVTDLQSNIVVGTSGIAGTLKYVADYSSAFTGDEASGNYLALHCEVPDDEDATITVEVVNGAHGPVTLDSDGLVVLRIADKDSQTVKVVASKEGYASVTKVYSLNGLVCQTE